MAHDLRTGEGFCSSPNLESLLDRQPTYITTCPSHVGFPTHTLSDPKIAPEYPLTSPRSPVVSAASSASPNRVD
jgi:hypothetical protein